MLFQIPALILRDFSEKGGTVLFLPKSMRSIRMINCTSAILPNVKLLSSESLMICNKLLGTPSCTYCVEKYCFRSHMHNIFEYSWECSYEQLRAFYLMFLFGFAFNNLLIISLDSWPLHKMSSNMG